MAVDAAVIVHLESLARLALDDEQAREAARDLGTILAYFEQLGEVDTDGVEELVRPVVPERTSRPDAVAPSLPRERVLALSNGHQNGFIRVPRTVDES